MAFGISRGCPSSSNLGLFPSSCIRQHLTTLNGAHIGTYPTFLSIWLSISDDHCLCCSSRAMVKAPIMVSTGTCRRTTACLHLHSWDLD